MQENLQFLSVLKGVTCDVVIVILCGLIHLSAFIKALNVQNGSAYYLEENRNQYMQIMTQLHPETPEEILNYVLGTGIHNVTLTGGEPLLQKDIRDLIHLLLQAGLQVEIETNGAVDLAAFCEERPVFTMDYKLPSSGCEDHMITENMELLEKNDTVKFVSGSQEDLLKALELIRTYDLINRCHVYLSPVFGSIEPVQIVEFMLKHRLNGVRLQIQMHKVIWDPDKRGV